MKKLYVWLLPFFMLVTLISGVSRAAEKVTKADLLREAWTEYGFQNWEKAESLFLKVLSGKPTDLQTVQARVGIIFIQQYRAPGQDHEAAILAYQSFLKELPEGDPIIPFIYLNMGYGYVAKQTPDLQKARECYHKGLELSKDKKGSMVFQQMVLRLFETYITKADKESVKEGLEEAKKLLPLMKGGAYESIAHSFAANFAYLIGDEKYAIEEFIKQYESGIASRSIKESVLFRIARTCETKFKDYKKAAKYYAIFAKEIPTSSRAYFCNIRAKELEKGIIDSEIFKGSIMKNREEEAAKKRLQAEKAKKAAAAKAKADTAPKDAKAGSSQSEGAAKPAE